MRGHLKNFVKKKGSPNNRPEKKKEPTRGRHARLVNYGSSRTIAFIYDLHMIQPLKNLKHWFLKILR